MKTFIITIWSALCWLHFYTKSRVLIFSAALTWNINIFEEWGHLIDSFALAAFFFFISLAMLYSAFWNLVRAMVNKAIQDYTDDD